MTETKPYGVFDFDGVFLLTWPNLDAYVDIFSGVVAEKYGLPKQDIADRMYGAMAIVRASPGQFGLRNNGLVSASADMDMSLLCQAAAEIAVNQYREEKAKTSEPLPNDAAAMETLMRATHFKTNSQLPVIPADDAKPALEALRETLDLAIVSNSDPGDWHVPNTVKGNIAKIMGPENVKGIDAIGLARKWEITPDLEIVPATDEEMFSGFPSPVYLRRGSYYDAVMSRRNQLPAVVCGDIIPLDTAMFEKLGSHTILAASEQTPRYEIKHYANHPNGAAIAGLAGIVNAVRNLPVGA
ncbi:hypothetical protein M1328_05385 [Patescibacteria group bacterium]|nr:hypothetical protein [Patescibacteria group bacterium]